VTQPQEADEVELGAADMEIDYFRGEKINLRDPIQEQVILALPDRVLCKPDCKGLCPQCGADLNEAACDCDRTPPFGKFAALKHLNLNKR
jgi:uncharacterized protein